jgi:hypothetical protein
LDPKLASALYGQGFAKLKGPDLVGVNVDIAAAKTIKQNIANEFCSLSAVHGASSTARPLLTLDAPLAN